MWSSKLMRSGGAVALALLAAGCSSEAAEPMLGGEGSSTGDPVEASTGEAMDMPVEPFEWRVEPPQDHGLDPAALERLRDYALAPEMNTQALLVVRHGVLVSEWYAPDRDVDSWATSWSMAKSVSSLLVGQAIADGHIASLDEPMTTWIPSWRGTDREPITLRHVLSMASGLAWNETDEAYEDLLTMALRADQLGYAIDQEVEAPPGQAWNYSSGTSMLLSAVISAATGQEAVDYARERLIEPLGFERFEWWIDGEGHTLAYCCMDATSRDFARLGLLMLQRGEWEGHALVPASWVDELQRPHQESNPSYGLQWWLNRPGGAPDRPGIPRTLFYAQGHDHQFVFVFPEQDMLMIRHAWFERPEGPPVAERGLLEAGMLLEGLAATGTLPPDESWDDTELLTRLMAAVIE